MITEEEYNTFMKNAGNGLEQFIPYMHKIFDMHEIYDKCLFSLFKYEKQINNTIPVDFALKIFKIWGKQFIETYSNMHFNFIAWLMLTKKDLREYDATVNKYRFAFTSTQIGFLFCYYYYDFKDFLETSQAKSKEFVSLVQKMKGGFRTEIR